MPIFVSRSRIPNSFPEAFDDFGYAGKPASPSHSFCSKPRTGS